MSIMKPEQVAAIVRDAGGKVVGRTRLQKIAYLLDVVGYGDEFHFAYKHYGPYSEDIAASATMGALLGSLSEEEHEAKWGGTYSIYTADISSSIAEVSSGRCSLAKQAAVADAVELELAATAVYLARDGHDDPWAETERRKPEKVTGNRLNNAKVLLSKLKQIKVPNPLPSNT